jgi:acetyl-CoA acetyltransferase
LNNGAVIAGVGHSEFGRLPELTPWQLEASAARAAVADAGLEPGDVDGLLTDPGPAQGILDGITPHFLRLGAQLGLDPDYAGSEILGGAGSVGIVSRAALAVEAGLCSACLCVYGDSPLSQPAAFGYGRGDDSVFGFFGAVGMHALAARRHADLYGTRPEQLGEVVLAARAHAARAPHALKQEQLNLDDDLASKAVAEPLRALDCCMVSDGAAAVLVLSAERAARLDRSTVGVLAQAQAHSLQTMGNDTHFDQLPAARSAPRLFERAGLKPSDVDLALLYDCFTIVVLMQLEDYGFCARGEAGSFVQDGGIAPGGRLPVNTSGGLLAECYGGGMMHVIEAVRQLRGEAGARQVADAGVALVSGHGLGMNTHTSLLLGTDSR